MQRCYRLGKQKESIQAVAMDRAGAYKAVVEAASPQAKIVFDKFHMIANFHRIIDEVRREEFRKASENDKDVVKGQRFNRYRHASNRTPKRTKGLMELLHMNENLCKAYILKDGLRQRWSYKYPAAVAKYLAKFVGWCRVSGVEALRRYGRSPLEAKQEVLNFCRFSITTAPLEGFNNTVSRILHRARGMTNLDYLHLKLRQESLQSHPKK